MSSTDVKGNPSSWPLQRNKYTESIISLGKCQCLRAVSPTRPVSSHCVAAKHKGSVGFEVGDGIKQTKLWDKTKFRDQGKKKMGRRYKEKKKWEEYIRKKCSADVASPWYAANLQFPRQGAKIRHTEWKCSWQGLPGGWQQSPAEKGTAGTRAKDKQISVWVTQ